MAKDAKKATPSKVISQKKKISKTNAKDNTNKGSKKALKSTNAKDRFHGRTVVITGGAGDFGKHCGIRMASEGANVVLIGRTKESLAKAKKEVEKAATGNARVMTFEADVTNVKNVESAVKAIEKEFTHVHYVFNNAGYQGSFDMVQNYDADDFMKIMTTNVFGVFNVLKAFSNHMIKNKIKGSIVNSSSKAATNCPPNMSAYAASKGAVWSFS